MRRRSIWLLGEDGGPQLEGVPLPGTGKAASIARESVAHSSAKSLRERGDKAFRCGEYVVAESLYVEASNVLDEVGALGSACGALDASLRTRMAQCALLQRRHYEALCHCHAVVDMSPPRLAYASPVHQTKALMQVALAYEGLGRLGEAREAARNAEDQAVRLPGLQKLCDRLRVGTDRGLVSNRLYNFLSIVVKACKENGNGIGELNELLLSDSVRVDMRTTGLAANHGRSIY